MYEDVDRRRVPCQSGRQTADSVISYEVGLEPIDLPRAIGGLGRNTLQSQPIAPHSDHAGALPSQPKRNSAPDALPAPLLLPLSQRTAPQSRIAPNRR
jgi:hypothetical protein